MLDFETIDQNVERVATFQDGVVTSSDAATFLGSLPPEVADVVFLDPPFNLGKRYGSSPPRDDRVEETQYREYVGRILELSSRELRPGGALFLYHLPRWAMTFGMTLGETLDFRHWIAVSMKNGYTRNGWLYPAHYALLYYSKGEPANFSRPKIPVKQCRHCGKSVKDYGGYAKHVEAGVSLSDIWDDVSPLRHRNTKKRKANELPALVMNRVVEIAGAPGLLLVDPFAGAGGSAIAARATRMRFAVNDRDPASCQVIVERLEETQTRE